MIMLSPSRAGGFSPGTPACLSHEDQNNSNIEYDQYKVYVFVT